MLLFLESYNLARSAISRLGLFLVGAFQFKNDGGSSLVNLVIGGSKSEDTGLLIVLLDNKFLHFDFVL